MSTKMFKQKTISGVEYETEILGARDSGHMTLRLGKLLEPVLSAAGQETTLEGRLLKGAGALLKNLSPEDFDYACEVFGKSSTYKVSGKKLPLTTDMQEMHFAGKLADHFQWLAFCVEANYRDFFLAVFAKLNEDPEKSPEV